MVPRLNIGGAETYVATLARALKERGYHVALASWGGHWAKKLKEEGIPHYLVPIRLNPQLASMLLEKVIKKEKIDLVHANSCDGGRAVYPVCTKMGLPWILTAHGTFGREKRHEVLKYADKIICVSSFLQNELITKAGLDANKLLTIYNGINLDDFDLQGYNPSLKEELGLREEDYVIGIISRIWQINTKGHDDLFQVLLNYPERISWKLLIVGKGRALSALKKRAQELKISHRVIFTGHRIDIPQLLGCMDVFAFPSSFETFGLAAAEASAIGKPVVAYAVGGVPEVVENGKTGFLVNYRDVEALGNRLDQLYLNPDMKKKMGLLGRERAEKLFDGKEMVEKITLLYTKVLEARKRENR